MNKPPTTVLMTNSRAYFMRHSPGTSCAKRRSPGLLTVSTGTAQASPVILAGRWRRSEIPCGVRSAPMDNGWQDSADAWVADMGESGDFGRRYVLDPVMLPRAVARSPGNALDVGCGEGRFCRMLQSRGVEAVGVDPTPALVSVARTRDPRGTYVKATAERRPFREEAFDLVVSYLSVSYTHLTLPTSDLV